MNFTLSACHVRTVLVAVGFYLLGRGELAFDDVQTLLGAAGPTVALIWKAFDAQRAAKADVHE